MDQAELNGAEWAELSVMTSSVKSVRQKKGKKMNGKIASLLRTETRPLTQDESKMLITLLCHKDDDGLIPLDEVIRKDNVFPYMVMVKRLDTFKKMFSPKLEIGLGPQIFCALTSNNPAKVVMWAYTLNEIFLKCGHKVTLEDWINEFPMGLPTEEEFIRIWDSQKQKRTEALGSDNKIDDFTNWGIPE